MLTRASEALAPELAIAAAAVGSWLTFRLLGLPSLVAPMGLIGLMLAAWKAGASLAETRAGAMLSQSRLELASARSQLEAAEERARSSRELAAIGRLTVGMAHDFNNQLTVISSNVELLKRSLGGADGRAPRHAEAALQGVQRAAALSARVLSLSRAQPPEPEAVEVNRLLADVAILLRRCLGHRVRLDLRLPRDAWFVRADINRMETAVLALALEACDRLPGGGVLTVAAETVRLDAARPGLLPGDYVRITVTGPGAGGTAPPGGDPGATLLLPRYVPPRPAVSPPRDGAQRRRTILVVEDDAEVRAACVEVLRDLDYEVLEAPDAMEGFRLIADGGGIDLLFTDIGLPGGVSGRALADAVRQVDAGVRVVFTTGCAAAEPHRPGTALLPKPFAPAQLAAAVRDALEPLLPEAAD
nr:response regulator [uncultured Rhodopila sp.]